MYPVSFFSKSLNISKSISSDFNSAFASIAAIAQRMVVGVDSFTLLAIPLFLLAGTLMARGDITPKIMRLVEAGVSLMRPTVDRCAANGARGGPGECGGAGLLAGAGRKAAMADPGGGRGRCGGASESSDGAGVRTECGRPPDGAPEALAGAPETPEQLSRGPKTVFV